MKRILVSLSLAVWMTASAIGAEQWDVFETSYESAKAYPNAFMNVEVDVVFNQGENQWKVPAFWDGGNKWTVRFAPPLQGDYSFRVQCSDAANPDLNGKEQTLRVTPYSGGNPLLKHGFPRVAADQRHFEHADGTPFFWLGDTWWKNLCKRLTWEGFQELAADRKKKGFSVIQIVCGPYPDEEPFQPSWENEGGMPYKTDDFKVINPEYWRYADRRLKHLVDVGMVPAIVGAWGRADCNAMKHVGVDGLKRHWRYLIARYGAYPAFWILGGEVEDAAKWGRGPWGEVGRYVKSIDPMHHPLTVHSGGGRTQAGDGLIIDYDMVGGSHTENDAIGPAIGSFMSAYSMAPAMPTLVGETCYEGHMQQGFQYVQRHLFWQYMLSGAAGHTYGAAGIWHASVEGDPGCASSAFGGSKVYDWTTWREGMNYPGATQIGLGKKLLEEYPWEQFKPHPEWAEQGSFAAGIPGKVRLIYQPRRNIYNWKGTVAKQLECDVPYHAFYFDPATGRRFELGEIKASPGSGFAASFEGHTAPLRFAERFGGNAVGVVAEGDASAWKDYGSPTQRKEGKLLGTKGMLTVAGTVSATDLMVSADARSDAEAGIVLRFHDPDNYVVAFYSPHLKGIAIHDRRNGVWGETLGMIETPGIAPDIHLTAAISGEYAALLVSDGKKSWRTSVVKVSNTTAGQSGLWFYQIGEKQAFDNFEVSETSFGTVKAGVTDDWTAPDLPSPQDWVLVLERITTTKKDAPGGNR